MTRLTIALLLALMCCGARARMALNLDVNQKSVVDTICVPGYTRTIRPATSYTNGVKRKLLREAGMDESHMPEFELDHIVPLALGGHPRSLSNLVLQPWEGSNGAKRKDRLEAKMQCLVCSGQVTLEQAQREIYGDWQAAYHKYSTVKCHRYRGKKR